MAWGVAGAGLAEHPAGARFSSSRFPLRCGVHGAGPGRAVRHQPGAAASAVGGGHRRPLLHPAGAQRLAPRVPCRAQCLPLGHSEVGRAGICRPCPKPPSPYSQPPSTPSCPRDLTQGRSKIKAEGYHSAAGCLCLGELLSFSESHSIERG